MILGCAALGLSCQKKKPEGVPAPDIPPTEEASSRPSATPSTASRPELSDTRSAKPRPTEIWKLFSGEKALAEVSRQVEIGPRPSGSAELEKARVLIIDALRGYGWEVQREEFTDETPRGPVKFANLIGRFGSTKAPVATSSQRAIVCSHYDTKRFSTISFVGANDGASSTGALVELARVLALDPALAGRIELVFFDGEEAVQQFTETDGLYGSRHYARKLRVSGRASQFKFAILWDMIGDRDLTITLPPDSPKELASGILATAESLGLRKHFTFLDRAILDDHYPLNQIKIPAIDLIDFDYLPWHTADDTLDKLSAESLQKIGAITLKYLREKVEP